MRYGFVLANIDKGSSVNLELSVLSQFSQKNGDILFVFPGGIIAKKAEQNLARNSVYDYANSQNIDAALIWQSTLTGELTVEEVSKRYEVLRTIPHVTINGEKNKNSQFPDISFDAYGGVKQLVNHAIKEHGAKKIAFIRGPENHNSANDRYRAYLDGLKENNIKFENKLVTTPRSWAEGDFAMQELLLDRKLVPGKDFDTLFCASDLMLYKALKKMDALGFGEDQNLIGFYGFNDSIDTKQLSVPCTTVRLPYDKLASKAYNTLLSMLDGKKTEKEIILDSQPVFRKSCGCDGFHTELDFSDKDDFLKFVCKMCNLEFSLLEEKFNIACKQLSESSIRSLSNYICANSRDFYSVNEIIELIPNLPFLKPVQKEKIYSLLRRLLPEEVERSAVKREIKEADIRNVISSFKNKLLEANTLKDIESVLSEKSKELGFSQINLVINRDDRNILIKNSDADNIEFSRTLILPEDLMCNLKPSVYIVEPLFTENEVYGHLVMETDSFNGNTAEEIRTSVSSAVKSSLLFEQVNLARQVSEKVEYDRTLFFSSIKSRLRNPVSRIFELIEENKSIGEDIKSNISSSLSQINRIVDMGLSKTNELETDFQVLDINVFLSEFKNYCQGPDLPCLFIDPGRLSEAISCVLSENSTITAKMTAYGVEISIKNGISDSSELSYASQMVIIHDGILECENADYSIVIPYPSLANRHTDSKNKDFRICYFGKKWADIEGCEFRQIGLEQFLENPKLLSSARAIMWDSSLNGDLARKVMGLIESNESFSKLPVIVKNLECADSLPLSLQRSIGNKEYEILFIGETGTVSYPWTVNAQLFYSDYSNAVESAIEKNLSLIVINNREGVESVIEKLRNIKNNCTPIIVCDNCIDSKLVSAIKGFPNVITLNTSLLDCEEISLRIISILGGAGLLPVYSGITVKKAQAFICSHYMDLISRWQIAEAIHVNEDYLTSIFKKEIGISLWDYLNRYRVEIALNLLQTTGLSMYEVSKQSGFQGQAYFCTVFKKIKGFSPSSVRKN